MIDMNSCDKIEKIKYWSSFIVYYVIPQFFQCHGESDKAAIHVGDSSLEYWLIYCALV